MTTSLHTAHQQALQTATKEYLHLAKSDAYQDAMIKARLARKLAANLGGPEPVQPVILPFQTQTVTPLPPLPPPHLEEGTYANGGEADNGEQVSNHSEEEFQNALVRSASPNKTREHSPAPVAEVETIKEEDPAEHMRNLLGEFVTHSTGAIKAAHDKLALAETAYSWVRRCIS